MKRGRPSLSPHHAASTWGLRLVAACLLLWLAGSSLGYDRAFTGLTLLGFAAAVAGIRHPVLGLFGVGLLTVLDPVMRHLLLNTGGWLRWNSFNYWLLLVTLLFLPRFWHLDDSHSRLLRLLLVVLAVGLLWAPRLENGIQNLLNVSTVFALVIYFQRTPCDDRTLCWLGIVMATAATTSTWAYYSVDSELTLMNKNAFSMLPLAGVLGACLGFPYAGAVRGGQPVLALLGAMNAAGVFLSRSRGTLLVALVALVFLLLSIETWQRRVSYLAGALSVALAAAAVFGALEATATARVEKLLDSSVSLEERTSGRANLVRGGWQIFRAHPLGVGTGAFEDAWAGLEQPEVTSRWKVGMQVPAHSAWIMVLAENGVPGMVLLTAYVGSFALVGLAQRDRRMARLGVFTTAVLATAFLTTEFQGKALWFVAAGATAILRARKPMTLRRTRPVRRRTVFDGVAIVDA